MKRISARFRLSAGTAVLGSLLAFWPAVTDGQALRVIQKRVTPEASSLTVSATPSLVSFTLVHVGAAVGNSPVSITTTWSNLSVLAVVSLFGYFTTSTTALVGNLSTAAIPTSDVFGQMTTGSPTSYTAFTQTNVLGGANTSLKLFSQTIVLGLLSSSRTDSLNLKIDITSLPQLPADTYTGTLILQAQEI